MNWLLFNLQDYNSILMLMMTEFHDFIMLILFYIMLYIIYIITWFLINNYICKLISHNQSLEMVWTLVPIFILIFMILPSLKILYLMEGMFFYVFTVKMVAHQWYWSYEYSDCSNTDFDSFMNTDLGGEIFRLLDVDNRLILPCNVYIRGLVSSLDVIHSWSLPALGLKIDAIPGRVNQVSFCMDREGVFFGQCSEICGLNHSFMPIVLESVSMKVFLLWLSVL